MSDTQVGMIGIGSMGGGMARRLLDCGVKLRVVDRNASAVAALVADGAGAVVSARELADECEVIIACLPSPEISLQVANEVAQGKAVKVYIDTSTIGRASSEAIARTLGERRVGFLDCPISGGAAKARSGDLAIMISGSEGAYALARPFLEVIGKNCFYLSPTPGLSQVAKLINNHISAAGRVAVFEGLAMGIKAGIDPAVLNQVFNAGSARNVTTTHKVESAILSGTFNYGSLLAIGLKDEALFIEEARQFKAALWLGPRILELYREAAAAGYKDQDSMNLFKYIQSRESGKATAGEPGDDC